METQGDLCASQRVVATLLALDGYADALIDIKKTLNDLGVLSADFDFSRVKVLMKCSGDSASPKFKNRLETYLKCFHRFYFRDLHEIPYSVNLLSDSESTMKTTIFAAIQAQKTLPNNLLAKLFSKHVGFVVTMRAQDDALFKKIKKLEGFKADPIAQALDSMFFLKKIILNSLQFFNVQNIETALSDHRKSWKERAKLYEHHYKILVSKKHEIPESELEGVFTYKRGDSRVPIPELLYDYSDTLSHSKELKSKKVVMPRDAVISQRDYFICPDGSSIAFCDDLCAKIVGKDFPADYYVYLQREPIARDTHIFNHDPRVEKFIKSSPTECEKLVKGNVAARKKSVLRKKLPLALELLLDYADFDANGFVNEKGVPVPNLRLYGALVPKDSEQEPIECQFEWGFDAKSLATCYHWVAREKPLNETIAKKASTLSHYKVGALDS